MYRLERGGEAGREVAVRRWGQEMKGFVNYVKGFGHSPVGKEYTLHVFQARE